LVLYKLLPNHQALLHNHQALQDIE
jgi:hypothetical protein